MIFGHPMTQLLTTFAPFLFKKTKNQKTKQKTKKPKKKKTKQNKTKPDSNPFT